MHGADEAMGTQTTRRSGSQSKSVVLPPALMVDTNYFTDHVRPLDGVLPAQTSANKLGVAMTISLNYPEQQAKPVNEALDTVTTNRPMALVSPFLATLRGTDAVALKGTASGLDEPVGTVSAGGVHHALVSGRAMGFLESHYSTGENVRGLDDAMGALSCRDRHGLVHGEQAPRLEDLYFRMLKPHEVQAGMAFDQDYRVLGNSREKVKQLGNAVTPPVMEMLVERCIESLM
jgi:DNA (cytosine-5)-methyltransferase 1